MHTLLSLYSLTTHLDTVLVIHLFKAFLCIPLRASIFHFWWNSLLSEMKFMPSLNCSPNFALCYPCTWFRCCIPVLWYVDMVLLVWCIPVLWYVDMVLFMRYVSVHSLCSKPWHYILQASTPHSTSLYCIYLVEMHMLLMWLLRMYMNYIPTLTPTHILVHAKYCTVACVWCVVHVYMYMYRYYASVHVHVKWLLW